MDCEIFLRGEADDMCGEQEYIREKLRRHNRYLHGWGGVCRCTVEVMTDANTPTVRACPGYAVGRRATRS